MHCQIVHKTYPFWSTYIVCLLDIYATLVLFFEPNTLIQKSKIVFNSDNY